MYAYSEITHFSMLASRSWNNA